MSTFNTLAQRKLTVGGNTAIWMGVVSPLPVGGILAADYCKAGVIIPAGSAVYFDEANKALYPFLAWKVTAKDTSNHTLTVEPNVYGVAPKADTYMSVVGASFATTGAAEKVNSIAEVDGKYVITFNSTNIESAASVGSYIAYSAATAAGASGKSLANQPNAYLYNDICIDDRKDYESIKASGAVVKFHAEGLLIQRTPCAPFATQMGVAVPNVCQILG